MRLIFALPAFFVFLASFASASFTMNLESRSMYVPEGWGVLDFRLYNSGDETAYDVRLVPLLPFGFSSRKFYATTLPPNIKLNGSFDVSIPDDAPFGTYPVVFILYYRDSNGYPFSVVFPESLVNREAASSRAYLSIPAVEISGSSPVDFKLRVFNQDSVKHNITVRLYLPDELVSDLNESVVEVNGQSSAAIDGKIWSNGALYDSDYLVLSSVSYAEGERMHSSIVQGRVKIVKPLGLRVGENLFSESKWIILFTVLFLILIMVYFTIRNKSYGQYGKKSGKKGEALRKTAKKAAAKKGKGV